AIPRTVGPPAVDRRIAHEIVRAGRGLRSGQWPAEPASWRTQPARDLRGGPPHAAAATWATGWCLKGRRSAFGVQGHDRPTGAVRWLASAPCRGWATLRRGRFA